MKILTIIIGLIALGLIGFNLTQVNYEAPFEEKNMVAIITIVASLCVILMMLILRISKRIEQKVNKQN